MNSNAFFDVRVTFTHNFTLLGDMEFGDRDLSSAIAHLTRGLAAEDPGDALRWLGTRRGHDGVGLEDSFDDLRTAYRVAAGADPTADDYRSLALAWAEGAFAGMDARGTLDAMTGLATRDYLALRVRDLVRLGQSEDRQLVTIGSGPNAHRLAIMLRAARLAGELTRSFAVAETPVLLRSGRIGALVAVDEGFAGAFAGLRRAIDRIDADPAAESRSSPGAPAPLRVRDLPTDADEIAGFLDAL